jgi:TMEM175 potassium channel family protein
VSSDNERSEPPAESPPGIDPLSRAGHLEYDRVLFFSDAIFAIAITLLVLDIRVPGLTHNPAKEIVNAKENILSFAISFVVIGVFWMGHHSISRYIGAFDRRLIALNLLFLGLIAFLPFPTGLLFEHTSGPSPWAPTVFYAGCIAAAGLAELAIWLYASSNHLLTDRTPPVLRKTVALRLLVAPVVFLVSIPIAFYSTNLATYFWLLIAVANWLLNRLAPQIEPAA